MTITGVDTTYWPSLNGIGFGALDVGALRTDAGLESIGGTYSRNETEAAASHDAARVLLGRDAPYRANMGGFVPSVHFQHHGVEPRMRAFTAVHPGLRDLLVKSFGHAWVRPDRRTFEPLMRLQHVLPAQVRLQCCRTRCMAEPVSGYNFRASKIWRFDGAAQRNRNRFITAPEVDAALSYGQIWQ